MNPLPSTRIVTTKRLALVILCVAASVFLLGSIFVMSTAHSQGQARKRINGKVVAEKGSPAERLAFSENGPLGRWSGSIIPDLSRNSSNSPVVVIGTGALMGNREWRNLQLTHVTLKNYSSKTVLGAQLKWFVTARTDRTKILPPPGYTGLFESYLKLGQTGKFESPLIRFSQAVEYLIKNSRLEGDFVVQVKVFQVEFEGGSTWNEPKPGEAGEPWHGQDQRWMERITLTDLRVRE